MTLNQEQKSELALVKECVPHVYLRLCGRWVLGRWLKELPKLCGGSLVFFLRNWKKGWLSWGVWGGAGFELERSAGPMSLRFLWVMLNIGILSRRCVCRWPTLGWWSRHSGALRSSSSKWSEIGVWPWVQCPGNRTTFHSTLWGLSLLVVALYQCCEKDKIIQENTNIDWFSPKCQIPWAFV